MYLLIEWEGRTGKYLARAGVRTHGPRAKYFSVRPDLTQSIIILSYDHFSFFIFIFFVKRGHARGSIASFRTHFQRNNKQRCELVIEAFRRPTVHRDNITVRCSLSLVFKKTLCSNKVVGGRPNRTNKAAFSNFASVVWMGPERTERKNKFDKP